MLYTLSARLFRHVLSIKKEGNWHIVYIMTSGDRDAAVRKKHFAEWTQKKTKCRSMENSCQEGEVGAVT